MMAKSPLLTRFKHFVAEHHLLQPNETVIVGVSGGVDSMTLLDLFQKIAPDWQIRLVAAHLNHLLRAKLAERDAAIVYQYCIQQDIPIIIKAVNVKDYAREHHLSTEMAGRAVRYAFFNELADTYAPAVIATAHTADDNAETILLNLIKGRGLHSLGGIPVRRGNIIRPLLFATKAELYAYAQQCQIPFAEDHTNRLAVTQRNVIRNQILPLIQQYLNPRVTLTLSEHSRHWQEAAQVIAQLRDEALAKVTESKSRDYFLLAKARLQDYSKFLQREIILECLEQLTQKYVDMSSAQVNRLLKMIEQGKTGRQLSLTKQLRAFIDREHLILARRVTDFSEEIPVKIGERLNHELFDFSCELADVPSEVRRKPHDHTEFIDWAKVQGELKLRPWRAGDFFRPLGMKGNKKVSDILIDNKIPLPLKKRIPLLTCGEQIIWVCGLVLADEFKITPQTKQALKIYYKEK